MFMVFIESYGNSHALHVIKTMHGLEVSHET